jgi:hypothetical protein
MDISRIQGSETALSCITDWYALGAAIGVKTNLMAWVLRERDEMQHRIKFGERIVFRSDPPLRHIQSRLITLFEPLFDAIPGTESIIAYRKGITATDVVRAVPHAKTFISFDIRHYYDNVTFQHIARCLEQLGLPYIGAKLAARYCVVQKGSRHTLQQGSPASPVLSNIVGHFAFDLPIKEWLKTEYPNLNITYLRYCDNIALFVHDEMPEGFSDRLKAFVKPKLAEQGFRTHKWATVADNHPVMHQKFLGMVINAEARAELDAVNRLRAILFNWCRNGLAAEARNFMLEHGVDTGHGFIDHGIMQEQFKRHLKGHIQYIRRLNRKQGLMLEKLYVAAEYLDAVRHDGNSSRMVAEAANGVLMQQIFTNLKSYRDSRETVEQYMQRIKSAA